MKAETTFQWLMDFDSEFFPTRKHCLNYLFCTIGNGYLWEHGELVDPEDPYSCRYTPSNNVKHAEGRFEQLWNTLCKEQESTKKLIPKYKPNPKYVFQWSIPSKNHSYLYNYPEDIQPDWKAAIEECEALLVADGITSEE